MTNTSIQFVGNSQGYLELDETTLVPITFSIADIRDISKKTGAFSKSIKVKGTKNNNILLNNYFDVNITDGTFNVNAKQSCIVIQNGVSILDNATIQLIDVSKIETTNSYDEQIEYTLLVKDMTSDFFTIINNKYLEDLDLKIPNHIFNGQNVINSNTNTYNDGYIYHLSFNQGDKSALDNYYALQEFKPAIFVRRYFDRIFAEATSDTNASGFRYNFPSMTDSDINLNNLIIPYNGEDKLTNSVLTYSASASGNTLQNIPNGTYPQNGYSYINDVPVTPLIINTIISNPDGLFNTSTATYTTPSAPSNNSKTTLVYDLDYEVYLDNPTGGFVKLRSAYSEFGINPQIRLGNIGASIPVTKNVIPLNSNLANGITTYISETVTLRKLVPNGIDNLSPNLAMPLTVWIPLAKNSYFELPSGVRDTRPRIRLKIISVKVSIETKTSTEFGYGGTIVLNDYIPNKIKQSDFLKGIFTMFNLYAEVDRYDSTLINISKRDDYYDNGAFVDWTDKLIKNESKQLTFLPLLTNKKLVLTYKQDDDIANENYFKTINEIYGQQEITFDNEYVKDIQKIETLFSPTPICKTTFGAVVPAIVGASPKNNIRILFAANGVFECNEYKIRDYNGQADAAMAFSNRYTSVSHFNKPTNPTFDLNFGICDFYFIDDDSLVINNNLYNLHWRRTLNQINNGKMLTAKFNLNELDIANMRLSDKILVNNSYWNVNKIIDYDANSHETTKVELISIDDDLLLPFTTRTNYKVKDSSPIRQSIWEILTLHRNQTVNTNQSPATRVSGINNWVSPTIFNSNIVGNNNTAFDGSVSIQGNNNTLSRNGIVNGSFNIVQADNVMVFGFNNVVSSGGTDAIVLGNGITADTANTTFANNVDISSGGTLTIGDRVVDSTNFTLYNFDMSTGVYQFAGITIGTGNTFNVGAAKGYSIDNTNVFAPIPTFIDYTGATNITSPYLLRAPATYVTLTSGGTLNLLDTAPDEIYYRANLLLGVIGHPNGTLTGIGNRPDIIFDFNDQMRDMFRPINLINDGIICYPNSTNLTLANTSGKLYGLGVGFFQNGKNNPTSLNISAGTPTTFQYRTQTGGTFSNTTLIIPSSYDNGGVVTAVGGGANSSTNQRIYLLENGNFRVQFGQVVYSTFAEAIAGAQNETFTIFSNNRLLGTLIGILTINKNCTNLTDTTRARFLRVGKFGESVGSAGGISTATLQSAYNNSGEPEITTNNTLLGVTIKRGSASDADAVLNIQNGSGSTKAYINGNGAIVGAGFYKSGGTGNQYLMADGSVNDVSAKRQNIAIITPAGSSSITFQIGQEFSYDWDITISGGTGTQREHSKYSVLINNTGNTSNLLSVSTHIQGTAISYSPAIVIATGNIEFKVINNSASNIYMRQTITPL